MLKNIFQYQSLETLKRISTKFLTTVSPSPATSEIQLTDVLKQKFPTAAKIEVKDISGGCGAMYEIYVTSSDFKNLSRVKQHQLITQSLKNEIKDMHGLRIFTATE